MMQWGGRGITCTFLCVVRAHVCVCVCVIFFLFFTGAPLVESILCGSPCRTQQILYRIFRCISRDFKTEKFAPKIDLDLYTDDNFKVFKIGADFLICCSNLQIIYP